MTPYLMVGYRSERAREVHKRSRSGSKPLDARTVWEPNVREIRLLINWLSTKPLDPESSYRTVVVGFGSKWRFSSQTAFLKLAEDAPVTAQLILEGTDTEGLLETVISRCIVERFTSGSYGDIIKDLTGRGVGFSRAGEIASGIDSGRYLDDVPSRQDAQRVDQLMSAVATCDVEHGIRVASGFDSMSLRVLQKHLASRNSFKALAISFAPYDPSDAALMVFHELR